MIKIKYELNDDWINKLIDYAKTKPDMFKSAIERDVQDAFDAGRDFQRRYKEETEDE